MRAAMNRPPAAIHPLPPYEVRTHSLGQLISVLLAREDHVNSRPVRFFYRAYRKVILHRDSRQELRQQACRLPRRPVVNNAHDQVA